MSIVHSLYNLLQNIDWIETKIPNINYILNSTELDIIEQKIIDTVLDFPTFWMRFSSNDTIDLLKESSSLLKRKSIGIILDLSSFVFNVDESKEYLDLIEELEHPLLLEVSDDRNINIISNYTLHGVLVKGQESAGFIGDKSSNILLRILKQIVQVPIYIKGGVGYNTALSYLLAGASGFVFDYQMLLVQSLTPSIKALSFIKRHKATDTIVLGESAGLSYRISSFTEKKVINDVNLYIQKKVNEDITIEEKRKDIIDFLYKSSSSIFECDQTKLIPISQDIFISYYSEKFNNINELIWFLQDKIKYKLQVLGQSIPLSENNSFAQRVQTKYPLLQGPMANITDNLNFSKTIYENGALPVIALGMKSKEEVEEIVCQIQKEKNVYPYALGLIGFNDKINEEYIDAIKKVKPKFIVLAGAKKYHLDLFHNASLEVFAHAPNSDYFEYLLDAGAKSFIFEGNEAGGHVGGLSLMTLIEVVYLTLTKKNIADPEKLSFIFAGGICDLDSSLMLNAALVEINERNINIGIQIGSAYLATKEALNLKLIDEDYYQSIMKESDTLTKQCAQR